MHKGALKINHIHNDMNKLLINNEMTTKRLSVSVTFMYGKHACNLISKQHDNRLHLRSNSQINDQF